MLMPSRRVFRQVSLDRLSSPEQLDQLMRVTSPKGWFALGGIGMILVAALVWGIIGSIPNTVKGKGVLIKSGGILEIASNASGRVADIAVRVGDEVTEGQVVARLSQPELIERASSAKLELSHLRSAQSELATSARRDSALKVVYYAQQRAYLEESIRGARASLASLEEKVEGQERLVSRGLLTRQSLLTTRQQRDAVQDKIRSDGAQLAQLSVTAQQADVARQQQLADGEARIGEAEARLAQLTSDYRAAVEVVSPYNGRILEILSEQGGLVGRGTAILTLDLTGRTINGLEAVIYVASTNGKMVKPGMEVRIAPSTVKPEEFGYMIGKITYVSDFPATTRGMLRMLKNEALVSSLSGGDAPYEVHTELQLDPKTASQYRWTSSKGPPLKIQSGTLAQVEISVMSQRPIELVIPFVRKHTGL